MNVMTPTNCKQNGDKKLKANKCLLWHPLHTHLAYKKKACVCCGMHVQCLVLQDTRTCMRSRNYGSSQFFNTIYLVFLHTQIVFYRNKRGAWNRSYRDVDCGFQQNLLPPILQIFAQMN